MKYSSLIWALLVIYVYCGCSPATATTIDFDPFPTRSTSGGILHELNYTFIEEGFIVEGFWGDDGKPALINENGFRPGHLHIGSDGNSNVELQHTNTIPVGLQGLFIRRMDGGAFSLRIT